MVERPNETPAYVPKGIIVRGNGGVGEDGGLSTIAVVYEKKKRKRKEKRIAENVVATYYTHTFIYKYTRRVVV